MSSISNKPLEKKIPLPIEESKLFDILNKLMQCSPKYFEVKANKLSKNISFSYKPVSLQPKFVVDCQIESVDIDKSSLTTTISHYDGMLTDTGHLVAVKIKDEFLEFLDEVINTGNLSAATIENSQKRFAGTKNMLFLVFALLIVVVIYLIYTA